VQITCPSKLGAGEGVRNKSSEAGMISHEGAPRSTTCGCRRSLHERVACQRLATVLMIGRSIMSQRKHLRRRGSTGPHLWGTRCVWAKSTPCAATNVVQAKGQAGRGKGRSPPAMCGVRVGTEHASRLHGVRRVQCWRLWEEAPPAGGWVCVSKEHASRRHRRSAGVQHGGALEVLVNPTALYAACAQSAQKHI
jgi:hypothetical protein